MVTGKKCPRFLVLSGDGINCEQETQKALEMAAARGEIVHINDLVKARKLLQEYDGIVIPGGFSFGDELGSGQILALKIGHYLGEELQRFVEKKKPILGICNGFQVLVKLGLLPFPQLSSFLQKSLAEEKQNKDEIKQHMGLGPNSGGTFLNTWVELEVVQDSVCIWTQILREQHDERIDLPIRHGEGRVLFAEGEEKVLFEKLQGQGQVVFRYRDDVNGSFDRIAGLCDPSGTILGLMPHPEASMLNLFHPRLGQTSKRWEKGFGPRVFESAVRFIEQH